VEAEVEAEAAHDTARELAEDGSTRAAVEGLELVAEAVTVIQARMIFKQHTPFYFRQFFFATQ
jgi:hypothetical protein